MGLAIGYNAICCTLSLPTYQKRVDEMTITENYSLIKFRMVFMPAEGKKYPLQNVLSGSCPAHPTQHVRGFNILDAGLRKKVAYSIQINGRTISKLRDHEPQDDRR
jgi:hypothetical protein